MASQLHSDPNTNIGQEKANHLINENSPYLLMHAKNPVDWYPWGQEGLDKAKKENKLLIISIGYSACHWCHVMEKESFSDDEVAKVMNEQFISIKVDREEHPDVDQVYMDAALLVNGTGGWPLNAIALPDGRPVFAGTYYPKNQWMYVLQELTNLFKNNPAKLEEQAIALTQGIQLHEKFAIKENDENVSREELDNIVHNILKNVDFQFGGHDVAPKFPIPVAYEFLLEYAYYTKNEKALEAVEITLKNMAWGGIYDQIGGGFARYSVDKYWIVPHFEKMLYDNAQLLSLYANAFLVSGKELYRQIVHQTAEFIKRELTDPRGGFYSSIDADSEGEEGKYYSWTKKEFTDILEEDAELVADYYNISGKGNWEAGKNTLYKDEDDEKFAKKWNMPLSSLKKIISTANEKLFKVREKRVKPARDTKIITAWNGLMISAFIKTYQALKSILFADCH
ncbi:MAG: thioredoxin domain-containing protein [Cyclobacteriaceae bacterium]